MRGSSLGDQVGSPARRRKHDYKRTLVRINNAITIKIFRKVDC